MNAKQTIPAIAKIAPPLLLGVVIFSALKWIFSDDDEKKKPDVPENTETKSPRKETKTTRENPVFRNISPEIPVKPCVAPILFAQREVVIPSAIPPAPNIPATSFSSAAAYKVQSAPPPPSKKPGIARADMAKIFQPGPLTRQAAVAALMKLGFGQTAAYAALLPDGRFSDWLQFAPDGVITWRD